MPFNPQTGNEQPQSAGCCTSSGKAANTKSILSEALAYTESLTLKAPADAKRVPTLVESPFVLVLVVRQLEFLVFSTEH